MKNYLTLLLILVLIGCAVPLTRAGQSIKFINGNQKDECTVIKLITFNQRLGPDKPGNALKTALNETAIVGGNSFYMISSSIDWAEGASIVDEALKCN
jgi:hypothetical protein